MINPKVFEDKEECLKCGGDFNKHYNLCPDCKSQDNSGEINLKHLKYKALEYREGDMNNNHIVVVTVKNSAIGTIKLIVPHNSQIANRVQYYVDNGITDYLEDGLTQETLINIADFTKNVIDGEIYLVLKTLVITNEEVENHAKEKNIEEPISVNSIETTSEKHESKLTNNEERIKKWQEDILNAMNETKMVDMNLFFLKQYGKDENTKNKRFMEDVVFRSDVYLYLNSKGLVNLGFCPITGEDIDQSNSYTMFGRKIFLSEKGMSICNEIKKNDHNKFSNVPYEKMVQKEKNMKLITKVLSSIISFYLSYQIINPSGIFSILFFLILGAVLIPIISFLLLLLYSNFKGLYHK